MEIADVQKSVAESHHEVFVAHKRDRPPQNRLVTPAADAGRPSDHHLARYQDKMKTGRNPRVSILGHGEQFGGSKSVQLNEVEIIVLPKPWNS